MQQKKTKSKKSSPGKCFSVRERVQRCADKNKFVFAEDDLKQVGAIVVALWRIMHKTGDPSKRRENDMEVFIYPNGSFIKNVDALIYRYFREKQAKENVVLTGV